MRAAASACVEAWTFDDQQALRNVLKLGASEHRKEEARKRRRAAANKRLRELCEPPPLQVNVEALLAAIDEVQTLTASRPNRLLIATQSPFDCDPIAS